MPGTKAPAVSGMFYPAEPAVLQQTVDAYLAAAQLPRLKPKALVVPHAGHVYSGPVAATGYRLAGLQRQGIKRVVLLGPNHRVPVAAIAAASYDAWATPLGLLRTDKELVDRALALPFVGVQDDAFAAEHSLEVQLPFIQRALGDVAVAPFLVGGAAPDLVQALLQALWGGPETLILVSSDLSHYHADGEARALDGAAAQAIEMLAADKLGREQACGRHAIWGLLAEARARDMRATTIDLRNSGDTAGPKDKVVGYGSFAFEYAHEARLTEEERAELGRIAQWVIRFGVENGRQPQVKYGPNLTPAMKAMRACFVTVTLDGALRGCVGSVVAQRRLVEDVVENAWKAAFSDPRFKPLTAEEAERIALSVSVLSTPAPLAVASEAALCATLRPDMDGLILRDQGRQSLFLPQVWSSIAQPQEFVRRLKMKAGLKPDHWSDGMKAFRFSTESFACAKAA